MPKPEEALALHEVVVEYPGSGLLSRRAPVRAVDEVSLTVHAGQTLGLVGESGSGKSSLVRAVLGLTVPVSGSVSLGGREVAPSLRKRDALTRRRMQMVFQDPSSALDPRLSVQDIVAEPLQINGIHSEAVVADLLDDVGLSTDQRRKLPRELSGGQRQRVGIARALALRPEVLILDEPVSALDVSVQAQVINLLADLQEEHRLAYLFIAHDLAVVRHLSHHVAVMRQGRIVETGVTESVFASPQHPYTADLIAAIPSLHPRAHSDAAATLAR